MRFDDQFKDYHPVDVPGQPGRPPVTLLLPAADQPPAHSLLGNEDLVTKCRAAWLSTSDGDPLSFRLYGPPGVGKNEVVYEVVRSLGREIHIICGHEEMTPEDLAISARVTSDNRVEYVASPLVAAMLQGGVCFFDEITRVPARSLSVLGSVLDTRRTINSVLAGVSVTAHPDFRFCAALNDADLTTSSLPPQIDERIRPAFRMDHPSVGDLIRIVRSRAPAVEGRLLDRFREWAVARVDQSPLSPRVALTIVEFAARLHREQGSRRLTVARADQLIESAAQAVLDIS